MCHDVTAVGELRERERDTRVDKEMKWTRGREREQEGRERQDNKGDKERKGKELEIAKN